MGSSSDDIKLHGWTAIAADATAVFQGKPFLHEPQPLLVKDIEFPLKDRIVSEVQALAREKLSSGTYNHSMRVYYYGKQTNQAY
jgi:cyanamide hydratase